MAPPRPGWSRRAQYGLFFGFIALVAGIVVGLALLALSLVAPSRYEAVRGAALDVAAPVTTVLNEIGATFDGLVGGAGNYWNAASQNGRLKREGQAMRQQILRAKAVLQENRQLKSLLALRERSREAVAAGRIVGSSFASPRRYAIFSAGTNDGIAVGMPVRSADGLIGRVVDAGATASRILLISDRANIVPARLLRNGQPVLSTGRGDGTVDLRPLEVGRNPFRRGDVVMTSGTGGLYPPMIPIARVIRLDDDGAIARPIADPANTSFAIAEQPFEPMAIAAESAPPPGTP